MELDDTHIINAINFAGNNLNNLQVLVEGDPAFQWILPELKGDYVQPEWMNKLISVLESTEFTKTTLVTTLRDFAKKEKIKFVQMMQLLRSLLSSRKDGYQVAEMLEILGKKRTIQRLSRIPSSEKKTKAQIL